MIRIPTHRAPTHPGEMLLQEFLVPMGFTQRDLGSAIHVPYQRINELVNHRRGIRPSTALRLAQFFGNSAEFWMNLQLHWDLYHAQLEEKAELKRIKRSRLPALGPPRQGAQCLRRTALQRPVDALADPVAPERSAGR